MNIDKGAYETHRQLRQSIETYLKTQYFGMIPILLDALDEKLKEEKILYREPFIESSPAYKTIKNGIQKSSNLPDWIKSFLMT